MTRAAQEVASTQRLILLQSFEVLLIATVQSLRCQKKLRSFHLRLSSMFFI
jgi:hypothetical protein